MTRESYKETYNDDPTDWPKIIHQYEFDWATPMLFLWPNTTRSRKRPRPSAFLKPSAARKNATPADFDNDETLEETLALPLARRGAPAQDQAKRVRKVHHVGGKVLEDAGYIAGKCIPIVVVYGKRWFVDNVERCMGHVRWPKMPSASRICSCPSWVRSAHCPASRSRS
jgi:hypothetical protein